MVVALSSVDLSLGQYTHTVRRCTHYLLVAVETIMCWCSVCSVLLQEHREGLKELEQLERQYRSARQQQVAEMPVSYSKPSAPAILPASGRVTYM